MKKIKYILGVGIISALFSTCFASVNYSGTLSVFHSVNSLGLNDLGNSNGILYVNNDAGHNGYGGFKINVPNYFMVLTGDGNLSSSSWSSFWGNYIGVNKGNSSPSYQQVGLMNFKFSFFTSNGFSLSGLYYIGDNLNSLDVFNYSNGNSFLGSLNLNYENGDYYPTIFDFGTYNYLTFNNETTLAYNGSSHNFGNHGVLKYCFYGIDFDLSCVFYDDILGYHYVNFSLKDDSIDISTGFLIIPLNSEIYSTNGSYKYGSFSGTKTMILSPIDSSNGNTYFCYNIIDLYSFDVSELKNGNILDKGIIGIDIDLFLNRTFLSSLFPNTNTISNGLGYFSEIFENSGTYVYRSNSLITRIGLDSSNNSLNGSCLYHFQSCMAGGKLPMNSDSNVPDILNSIGNVSSFTGEISLNPGCVQTQICYELSGTTYCTTRCVSDGDIPEGSFIGANGIVYFSDSSVDIENLLKSHSSSSLFDSSYIDEDGILSPNYFSGFFTPGSYKIGVCPYNYYDGPLDFLSEIKVGDLYIFKPILCYYSAFQEGKSVKYFEDYEIFPPEISSQLINGDSDKHILLYRFFDVLFAIGILGLLRYLSRHIF